MLRRCVDCWWACPWSPSCWAQVRWAPRLPLTGRHQTAWPGLACPALPCSCSSPGLPGSASQPANPCCPSTRCAAAIKVVAGQMLVYPNEYALPLMPNFGLPPPPVGMLHVKVGWAGVCGLGGGCVVCAGGGGTHALVPAACLPACLECVLLWYMRRHTPALPAPCSLPPTPDCQHLHLLRLPSCAHPHACDACSCPCPSSLACRWWVPRG